MKRILYRSGTLLICATLLFSLSCADSTDASVEEARFLLDQRLYSEVEVLMRAALVGDPNNNEVKEILAAALIGKSILGEEQNALGLLAILIGEQEASGDSLQMFGAIAPPFDNAKFLELEEARDLLISIPEADRSLPQFLRLYLARLFEISTSLTIIGATNPDNLCNADEGNPNTDGIPDGFDPDALDGPDQVAFDGQQRSARLDENIDSAPADGTNAGLGEGAFGLNDALNSMKDALENATDLTEFLNNEFGDDGTGALQCTL